MQYALVDVVEDEAAIREADETARKWLADPSRVDPDTAAVMVDLGSRKAGDDRIDALIGALKKTTSPQDRQVALHALAGFNDPTKLEHALDRTLTDDIAQDEVRSVVGGAMMRRVARPTAWQWLAKHWDEVQKKVPGHLSLPIVNALGFGCTTREADEIATFFVPRTTSLPGAERRIAEAAEETNLCVALRRKGATSISNALGKKR